MTKLFCVNIFEILQYDGIQTFQNINFAPLKQAVRKTETKRKTGRQLYVPVRPPCMIVNPMFFFAEFERSEGQVWLRHKHTESQRVSHHANPANAEPAVTRLDASCLVYKSDFQGSEDFRVNNCSS